MQKLPNIKLRPLGKLVTTPVTNELASAINGLAIMPVTGQFDEAAFTGGFLRAKLTGQTLKAGGSTGIGWYSGVLANEPSGVTASLPFTETMFGTAGSTQIYVANHAEIGGTGTALPLPCFCLVLFHRNDINDGTPCYLFVADIPTEPYVCPTGSGSGS